LVRDLQIDYTATSLVAPEKVRFRTMLEGWDDDWVDVGARRQAFYNDLPPGNYRFRVSAANNSGVWNEAGAALDLSIAPAFFQTAWFRLLVAAALAAAIWGAYRWRVRMLAARLEEVQQENRERVRAEEALRESQERYALAVAGSNEGIFDWDLVPDRVYLAHRTQELARLAARRAVADARSVAGAADLPSGRRGAPAQRAAGAPLGPHTHLRRRVQAHPAGRAPLVPAAWRRPARCLRQGRPDGRLHHRHHRAQAGAGGAAAARRAAAPGTAVSRRWARWRQASPTTSTTSWVRSSAMAKGRCAAPTRARGCSAIWTT
jgi:PAS domain-containing protein